MDYHLIQIQPVPATLKAVEAHGYGVATSIEPHARDRHVIPMTPATSAWE